MGKWTVDGIGLDVTVSPDDSTVVYRTGTVYRTRTVPTDLLVLNADTGEVKWQMKYEYPSARPAFSADGLSLFMASGGHLSAVSVANGESQWKSSEFYKFTDPNPNNLLLSTHKTKLYFAVEGGIIAASATTGESQWSLKVPCVMWADFITENPDGTTIYASCTSYGVEYSKTDLLYLFAMDPGPGVQRWNLTVPRTDAEWVPTLPVPSNKGHEIYWGHYDKLIRLAASTGATLWEIPSPPGTQVADAWLSKDGAFVYFSGYPG